MDDLDLQILRALGVHPFIGAPRGPADVRPAQVAKAVGTTLDTAKARIRRMEDAGIIRGYDIQPNLMHLGLRRATYHMTTAAADKTKALETVVALDGVADVMDFVGPEFDVTLCFRQPGELERRLDVVQSAVDARVLERYAEPRPEPAQGTLSVLDWRIIKALRGRAKRDLGEVADELGVSRRTILRRLETMTKERSTDVYALIDPGPFPGVIPLCLVCRFKGASDERQVRAVIDEVQDHILFGWVPCGDEPGHFRLPSFALSLGDAEALRRRALRIEGVESAETQFPSGKQWRSPWVDEAIDAQLHQVP